MAKSDDETSKLKTRSSSNQLDQKGDKRKPDVSSAKSKPMGFAPMVTLLLFSFAMLILPLLTYFGIREYIVKSTTISAMGAIVMVQIIVAAYIYKAWNDENREHQTYMKEKLKKH